MAKPIEDKLAELDDVKDIESTVRDNVALVVIKFEAFTDPDEKYDEVQREINALRLSLPGEISRLEIRKFSPALVNTVQFALVSETATYRELEDLARDLKDRLKTVDGVRTAESWAFPARELRVEVDLRRMAELNVTPGALVEALQSENSDVPAGSIDLGSRSFTLKTSGSYQSLDAGEGYRRCGPGGGHHPRPGRRQGVLGGPALELHRPLQWPACGVRHGKPEGRLQHPQGSPGDCGRGGGVPGAASGPHQARVGFRPVAECRTAPQPPVTATSAIAIALVSITLLPLGLRAAGIVMVSIPLSLSFGLACIYFLGFSLNQLSIAGFVLALGLLVDDSIVVVENISRHLRMGYSRAEAALKGTQQIFQAILGCTATLLFAFLPLMVLPETAGKFIRVLPTTVITTITRLAADCALHHPVHREPRAPARNGGRVATGPCSG